MHYFIHNGQVHRNGATVFGPDNRGFRYGDGVFETLKYKNGRVILADLHFYRLWNGLQLLKFSIPEDFTPVRLLAEIERLIVMNKHALARVRITVTRGENALFDLEHAGFHYVIQCWPIPEHQQSLNEKGLELCIYPEAKKSVDGFSHIKHNNFLPYVMGAIYATENGFNDAVILNSFGRIAETSIANIFVIKDELIRTPSLGEGCIAGIIRRSLLTGPRPAGFHLIESEITQNELLEADEVFLTNSIMNLRWVACIGTKKFGNSSIKLIDIWLRQTNADVFC